jgi:hypothetical protein
LQADFGKVTALKLKLGQHKALQTIIMPFNLNAALSSPMHI